MKRVTLASALAFATLVAASPDAAAFCRSRTCNPYDPAQHCEKVDNCVITGHELWWNSSCVSYDAQADGSPLRGITAKDVQNVVGLAFEPWLQANCGSGQPSMTVGTYGPVQCDEPENTDPNHPNQYNRLTEKGANVVMFRDDGWPYPNSTDAYALTTVTFNPDTGEIFDADIEVNSADFNVTVDGTGTDLQSILTHEVGHFLGMAHAATADMTATMREHWNGNGTDLRSLTADDEAGICDAYPPERVAAARCEPVNGLADTCHVPKDKVSAGCSFAPARGPDVPTSAALYFASCLLTAGAFGRRIARRRSA